MPQILDLAAFATPSHVFLNSRDQGHMSGTRQVLEYISRLTRANTNTSSELYGETDGKRFHIPLFDIRETADAYYLEGDFAGVCEQGSLFIEKLGPDGVLVEARSFRVDLDKEWGAVIEQTTEPAKISSGTPETDQHGQSTSKPPPPGHIRDLRLERPIGHFRRSFTFPENINFTRLRAVLKDGLLRIYVVKERGGEPRDRATIEIKNQPT